MRYPVKVRQERPTVTRAPHSRRFWEVHARNSLTKAYEYYASVWTFEDAIELANRVWPRVNNVNPLELREPPC